MKASYFFLSLSSTIGYKIKKSLSFNFIFQGHWSDKHGNIDVLTICLVLASIAYASTSFALNNFYILVVIRIFLGVFKHTQDLCRLVCVLVCILHKF